MPRVYKIEIDLTAAQYHYIEAHMVKPGVKGREAVTTVCASLLHELLRDDMAERDAELEADVACAEQVMA
jgi:hypothetical protein